MTADAAVKPSTLRRVTGVLLVLAVAVLVVAHPAAWVLDRASGRDVILLAQPADAETVTSNREQFDDTEKDPVKRREAIVAIYGSTPSLVVSRVLFVDDADVIHPVEDPTLALVTLEKDGARRVQSSWADFIATIATFGAAGAFVALLVVRRFVK